MKKTDIARERFECTCFSTEHHFIFTWWKDDPENPFEVDLEVYLSTGPWYYRLWSGIKYIFGYTSKYGHWDNTLLDETDLIRLHELTTLWTQKYEKLEDHKTAL